MIEILSKALNKFLDLETRIEIHLRLSEKYDPFRAGRGHHGIPNTFNKAWDFVAKFLDPAHIPSQDTVGAWAK